MKHGNIRKALAALLTGLMLLALMGAAPSAKADSGKEIEVKDADGLVAAVASGVTVKLLPGEFNLAAAASYGKDTGNPYCRWEVSSDTGYELNIVGVEGLTIKGAGMDNTVLLAEDRFANVLTFTGCQNVTASHFTAGHSPAPGYCSGGVLHFVNCINAAVENCGLFGCGSMGVWADNCNGLTVSLSRIYECSDNAVCIDGCRNVQILDSEIDHNGWKNGGGAYCLFQVSGGDVFNVSGCRIHDNKANLLLNCSFVRNARFVSNWLDYNILQDMFALYDIPVTVDGCAFHGNDIDRWYSQSYERASLAARDMQENTLSEEDLSAMELRLIELPEVEIPALAEPAEVAKGGEIVVTTADEFLAAIGPDRTIVLDGESFSLPDAAAYGTTDGRYYRWEQTYDGPQLVISNVSGLTIRAEADRTDVSFTAVPRYADVIRFLSCDNISVIGLTMGHTEGAGECSGAVLDFENCFNVSLERCRLYGCGTMGVNASCCRGMKLSDCEIYDCTIGGAVLYSIYGAAFENCRIHDVPSPMLCIYNSSDVTWNGTALLDNHYDATDTGELVPVAVG